MDYYSVKKSKKTNKIKRETRYDDFNDLPTPQEAFSREENVPWSVVQEPTIDYDLVEHLVVIDSADRDRNAWPNPNNYQIKFRPANGYTGAAIQQEYKNIRSIELVHATFPATNSVTSEPYLLLNIKELEGMVYQGTNLQLQNAFGILYLDSSYGSNTFINADLKVVSHPTIYFRNEPLANLNQMTISITNKSGTPFNFGSDTSPPTAVNATLQNMLVFKIKTSEKSMKQLQTRSVY